MLTAALRTMAENILSQYSQDVTAVSRVQLEVAYKDISGINLSARKLQKDALVSKIRVSVFRGVPLAFGPAVRSFFLPRVKYQKLRMVRCVVRDQVALQSAAPHAAAEVEEDEYGEGQVSCSSQPFPTKCYSVSLLRVLRATAPRSSMTRMELEKTKRWMKRTRWSRYELRCLTSLTRRCTAEVQDEVLQVEERHPRRDPTPAPVTRRGAREATARGRAPDGPGEIRGGQVCLAGR